MGHHLIKGITHEQWLEERKKGIGSSEVGTILGVNKYETLLELWLRKTGRVPGKPMTEAMEEGHLLEATAAEFFSKATGCAIKKNSAGDWLAVDNEKDFLRVSPDRLYWEAGARHCPRNYRIVECKTTALDVDPTAPPPYWLLQLQYQMGVMGIRAGAISWLSTAFRFHHGYKLVPFDDLFYNMEMVPRLEYFWKENILRDITPTPHLEEELRITYAKSQEGLKVEADAETMKVWMKLKDIKKQVGDHEAAIKALEDEKSTLHAHIMSVMKDSEELVSPDGKTLVTWKNAKDTEKFNMARFKAEDNSTYKKYLYTEKGARRFSIK